VKIDELNNSERSQRLRMILCEKLGLDPEKVSSITLQRNTNTNYESDTHTDEWVVRAELWADLSEDEVREVFEQWG